MDFFLFTGLYGSSSFFFVKSCGCVTEVKYGSNFSAKCIEKAPKENPKAAGKKVFYNSFIIASNGSLNNNLFVPGARSTDRRKANFLREL